MEQSAAEAVARELMMEFAAMTGLAPVGEKPRRYLWTDAFAVCNFLGFFRRSGDDECRQLALTLVRQVHEVLGRHREDDSRSGWISGLDEEAGCQHPTRGGLRIGKSLNERGPAEPFDERQEWDRDGQYYHYLTKWMHALDSVARVAGDTACLHWAMELAKTAHAAFTYPAPSGDRKRMCWKMSIDLSRPLVPSMGQHDPLDGLVTCYQLQATAGRELPHSPPDLSTEIAELAEICRGMSWATDDPLGTGGLLFDACRLVQLMNRGACGETVLLESVLDAALLGLEAFSTRKPFRLPAAYRLAFRELGLSIGLKAVDLLRVLPEANSDLRFLRKRIEPLLRYLPLREQIETFWMEEDNRRSESWTAHREINTVMLATSLAPGGYLEF